MKQWFAVHTQSAKEQLAEQHLRQQGFEVYLPRYKKIRRHARKIDAVLAPLFPRYLFIRLDLTLDLWQKVNGTRGVVYLLMNNNYPISVSDFVVNNLKAEEDLNGTLPISSLILFTKGDKVRVCEGKFAGHTAIFEKLDGEQRVQILLSFLGRETRVSFPTYAVEAA